MKTMIRASLLLAAIAGLFVCCANTFLLNQKVRRLRFDLRTQTEARGEVESALAHAVVDFRAASAQLRQTESDLEAAEAERQTAVAAANIFKARLVESAGEKLLLTRERDETRQDLQRYKRAGLAPEEILKASLYIRELESSVTKLQTENQILQKRITAFQWVHDPGTPPLPSDLTARVLACDPKWGFLVLDVGESGGALARGELLVSRQGKLVAKVKIARVEKDCCIANLLPNWNIAEVMEGDVAIPAPI